MLLRANVLAKGFSGVRLETLELLVEHAQPRRPPGRALAGLGRRQRRPGPARPPRARPRRRGRVRLRGTQRSPAPRRCAPPASRRLVLEPKEGLALINGTQLMTAVGGLALAEAPAARAHRRRRRRAHARRAPGHRRRLRPAHPRRPPAPGPGRRRPATCGACSRAARCASRTATAAGCRTPTACAACRRSTAPLRDALELRRPRVHLVEMNSATDNPMVFAETGEILSGGNFHGQPVAIAADLLAIAAAELGRHQRAAHASGWSTRRSRACPPSWRARAGCTRAS